MQPTTDDNAAGPSGRRSAIPVSFALFLILAILVFTGLLGYARGWLAMPLGPRSTVYLVLMVGMTVGVWLLTCAYILLTHAASGRGRAR
jgi:uncharacterized membrane protein (DUF485 family)